MKIRDVKAMTLTTGSIFVRVETDVDGLVGWGECSPMNAAVLTHFVNTALAPRIVGEDPREIDRLWHAMFFGTAALFWWGLVHGRYGRLSYGVSVVYVFATALHKTVLGALITVAGRPLYRTYGDALPDQQLAGLIMWVPACVVMTVVGLALFAAWLGESERRARRAALRRS